MPSAVISSSDKERLRNVLAKVFDRDQLSLILQDLELSDQVAFEGAPQIIWANVIAAAERRGKEFFFNEFLAKCSDRAPIMRAEVGVLSRKYLLNLVASPDELAAVRDRTAAADEMIVASTGAGTRPVTVYISHDTGDKRYLRELEKHLSDLRREGIISTWNVRKIPPGAERAKNVDAHLNTADVILVLLSADYIASDYCYGVELKRAMERYERGEVRIIPILVRPTAWKGTPLSRFEALPADGRAVSTWKDRDTAYTEIVESIREVIEEMRRGG